MNEPLKGEFRLEHSRGSAWVGLEVPREELGQPNEVLLRRYMEPALAAVLEMIRLQLSKNLH